MLRLHDHQEVPRGSSSTIALARRKEQRDCNAVLLHEIFEKDTHPIPPPKKTQDQL